MTFQLQSDAAQMYEKVLVPYWFDHWAKATFYEGRRICDGEVQ